MNIFNSAEVIDMGIEKEKRRRDFYGLVASSFKDGEMKKLFTQLKEWEETHIKKFTEIRKGAGEYETFESFPGELDAYMRSIVDDKLYMHVTAENFSKNVKTPIDAINYGITFEKDAILFFTELEPYVSDNNRKKVKILIDEEKAHLVYLTELKNKYR